MCLMSDMRGFIQESGGEETLANLIMSESPEFFHAGDECGVATRWLRKRGIYSNEDVQKKETRNFSVSEVEYIIINASERSAREIARVLHRPVDRIVKKIQKLRDHGILPKNVDTVAPDWSDAQLGYLKTHAEKIGNVALGGAIGRSAWAVATRKYMLGLKLDPVIAQDIRKEYRRVGVRI